MGVGDRILLTVAPLLASLLIRMLHLSMRIETIGGEHLQETWQRGQQVILSFWHDQLLLMILGYPGEKVNILISASKDGELIARTMNCFGQDAVRGSSNRGGRAAFRELVNLAKEPVDLAVTPDGPKGPRHELKDGIVQLARLSGRPVVPMTFVCSAGHRFKSWDRFLLPYPFGRGVYAFGEALYFDRDEGVENFRQRLQDGMRRTLELARARLEEHGLSAV